MICSILRGSLCGLGWEYPRIYKSVPGVSRIDDGTIGTREPEHIMSLGVSGAYEQLDMGNQSQGLWFREIRMYRSSFELDLNDLPDRTPSSFTTAQAIRVFSGPGAARRVETSFLCFL